MAFTKKAKTREDIKEDKDYPYQLIIADADTPVFRASKFVQEDYVVVTHIPSGNKKEFANKTEFHGHWKKKEGGWLREQNDQRVEKGLEPFPIEDFEIEECVRLVDDIEDHVEEGVKNFDFFVGSLKKQNLAPEYKLCIGGSGNFRYDLAQILPYKGDRPDKPLLFEEIRERIISKYKKYIEIVDGKEADDQLAVYGLENYLHYKETGEWKYCLAFVDKDLKMIISPSVNYDDYESGVTTPTPFEAAEHFCKQLLCGDKSTDNIQGLPKFTEEVQEKYNLRKTRGIGDATALNYLKGCDGIPELFERVVEAYRSYYGDDTFEFETHRGDIIQRTWIDMLNENATLLRMHPDDNYLNWHIASTLDKLGVEYE